MTADVLHVGKQLYVHYVVKSNSQSYDVGATFSRFIDKKPGAERN